MTTEIVCTCRSSGGDYSSGVTFESDLGTVNLPSANTLVFSHGGITGSVASGDSVTGGTSGATGTVVLITATQILIESITGTFSSGEQVYKTASVDYVDISDAGDDAIAVLEYYDDWASGLDEYVTIAGQTTNTTNYIVFRAAAGQGHVDGVHQSGFYAAKTGTYTGCWYANNVYTVFQDLDGHVTGSNSRVYQAQKGKYERCLGQSTNYRVWFNVDDVDVMSCCACNSVVGFGMVNYAKATFQQTNAVNCGNGWLRALLMAVLLRGALTV